MLLPAQCGHWSINAAKSCIQRIWFLRVFEVFIHEYLRVQNHLFLSRGKRRVGGDSILLSTVTSTMLGSDEFTGFVE
jgi:hypothetical protein